MIHGPAIRPLQFGWEISRSTESVASFHPSKVVQISRFAIETVVWEANTSSYAATVFSIYGCCQRDNQTRSVMSTLYLLPRSVPGRTFCEYPWEMIKSRHLPYHRGWVQDPRTRGKSTGMLDSSA